MPSFSTRLSHMGSFRCPQCNRDTVYKLFTIRKELEVAGVSLIPWKKEGEFVECQECRSTYISEVLDPDKVSWKIKPLQLQAAMRVMLLTMLADGEMQETEIRKVAEVYTHIGGEKMHSTAVRTQAEHAKADPRGIEEYLEAMAPRLNESGKLAIVKSAWEVANADGKVQEEERQFMKRVAKALKLKRDPLEAVGVHLGTMMTTVGGTPPGATPASRSPTMSATPKSALPGRGPSRNALPLRRAR